MSQTEHTPQAAPAEQSEPQELLDRIPDYWGKTVSTGPGWYPLLRELDADLALLAPKYILNQVKEKFGGLRYYVELPAKTSATLRDKVDARIRAAEDLAWATCETCGQPGSPSTKGYWHRTACPAHQ